MGADCGRRPQVEGPMSPMGVVVIEILPQHRFEVAAPEDEHPVQALPPERPDPLSIPRLAGHLH